MITEDYLQQLEKQIDKYSCIFGGDAARLIELIRKEHLDKCPVTHCSPA